MQILTWIVCPWVSSLAFWAVFASCVVVEGPGEPPPPAARLITSWDPLACGEPRRVVLELEDEGGAEIAASAPCAVGMVTLDVPSWGVYRGRIYTWLLDQPIRSETPVSIEIDGPVIRWQVTTPP